MQPVNDEDDEFLVNRPKINKRRTFKQSAMTVNSMEEYAEDLDKIDQSREL